MIAFGYDSFIAAAPHLSPASVFGRGGGHQQLPQSCRTLWGFAARAQRANRGAGRRSWRSTVRARSRSVRLTSAGALVCERARRLLVDADDLAEIAKRLSDPMVRDLRVGVIPTISPYLLPEVVPSLRRDLPGLTLFWTEDQTNVLLRKLQDGDLDAALLALETRLPGDFEKEELARDPFVLAMASSHPLAKKKGPVRISEIAGMDLLLLDDGHCLRDQALAACKTARAHELDFRATSLSTLVQMVSAGSGVTLLPRLALPVETKRSDLALRAFAKPVPYRTLGLIWRRGSAHAEALRKVAASIRAVARKGDATLVG